MPEWMPETVGMILGFGVSLLVAGAGYWLLRNRRRRGDDVDEAPTEIAVEADESDADAYLVALEASLRLPQHVPLFVGREIRLGRDRHSNTVTLNDISISRRHATIFGRGPDFYIRDENSRGGTFVNHRRLHKDQKVLLNHNAIVQFYTFTYRFVLSEAPTQTGESETTVSTRLDDDQHP